MNKHQLKIGDIICRKDMPELTYMIIGESNQWKDMWHIETTNHRLKGIIESGFIAKDDDRWEIQPPKEAAK